MRHNLYIQQSTYLSHARARLRVCVCVIYVDYCNFNVCPLFVVIASCFFLRVSRSFYVKEHIIFVENMLSNILFTIALLLKTPELCTIEHKRYKVMKAIVVKMSDYKNAKYERLFSSILALSSSVRIYNKRGFVIFVFTHDSNLTTCSSVLYIGHVLHHVIL